MSVTAPDPTWPPPPGPSYPFPPPDEILPADGCTPDPATQFGPGSPVAVERGCSCDPPVFTVRPGSSPWPALLDDGCPIHGQPWPALDVDDRRSL